MSKAKKILSRRSGAAMIGCRSEIAPSISSETKGDDDVQFAIKYTVGVISTAIVIADLAGLYSSFFFLRRLRDGFRIILLCMIPMEIVASVTWGAQHPKFAGGLKPAGQGSRCLCCCACWRALIIAPLQFAMAGALDRSADADAGDVHDRFGNHNVLAGDYVGRLAVHEVDQESAGGGTRACWWLATCSITFFSASFSTMASCKGAPVYVASLDPHGLFNAWNALVFYLTRDHGDVRIAQFRFVAVHEISRR